MKADFHWLGTNELAMHKLKRCVKIITSSRLADLISLGLTPSGPADFGFNFFSWWPTFSSVKIGALGLDCPNSRNLVKSGCVCAVQTLWK